MKNMQFSLWFKDHLVGNIDDCFLSDKVWYGRFVPESQAQPSAISQRVAEFAAFCESWNEQVRDGNDDADESQFEQFDDVVCDGCWLVKDRNSSMQMQIEDAPMFFVKHEISFRPT